MTSIAAIGSAIDRPELIQSCAALSTRMQHRGVGASEKDHGERFALAVSRFDWECDAGLQGPATVARQEGCVAVADGTLYYQADLRRALESRGARGDWVHAADLILAAYRAYGDACLSVLEGDFAFVIWEGRRGRIVMGRDHSGRRPLHYWATDDKVLVASTARALATHPLVGAQINEAAVVGAVGALLGGSLETGFVNVHPIPASALLAWEPHRGVREVGRWTPPVFNAGGKPNVAEGGRELRRLLGQAAAERCGDSHDVAIWLSGGADSPAVLGALSCTEAYSSKRVSPVTISYPEGDAAREDEHVQAIADALGLSVTWQNSETIDLLGNWTRLATERDDPYAHMFEGVNRRLAQCARDAGARVVFDGYGGDQLFDLSDVFLADLLARGRLHELASERQLAQLTGVRSLVRTSILPLLPEKLRYLLSRARGYSPDQIRWQTLPAWITPAWREHPAVAARYEREPRRRLLESPSAYESRWYVESPYFPRAISWTATFGLSEGVDLRSPLYDRRVLCFAASRPLRERGTVGASKPLLREAMQGVLPASYLDPRPHKTGIPGDYLRRQLRTALPKLFGSAGDVRSWHLTRRGLIDQRLINQALRGLGEHSDHQLLLQIFLTVQAEFWTRSVTYG